MNRVNICITDLARICNVKYTSFKDRLAKDKLYAFEVEMIAEYFGRSISYYFDAKENGVGNYPDNENLNFAEEPKRKVLLELETNQKKIESLTKKLNTTKEKLDKVTEKYLKQLEMNRDKNDNGNKLTNKPTDQV